MKQLFEKLNFTKNEIRVIIFLIIILTAGFCIKITKGVIVDEEFDFSKTDKMFQNSLNRFAKLNDSTDFKDSSIFTQEEKKIIEKVKANEDSLKIKSVKKKSKKEENLTGKSININSATKEQLILLPGIGESTAEKILIYRTEKGRFKKVEDIMKIKGIGKKKFAKLKEYIVIE